METKSAYKTTEFIATAAVLITVLCSALAEALPPKYAAISGAVAVAGYSIARGLAKLGIKPDQFSQVEPPKGMKGV